MKSQIFLFCVMALASAYPINEDLAVDTTTTDDKLIELKKEVDDVIFQENFKSALTEYVMSEDRDLTLTDKEKIQDIIEDLLRNLVRDFQIILNKDQIQSSDVVAKIGDTTFDEIHKCIILGIPNINEHNALRLSYRLERNLLHAREKLDRLINESKMARLQNS
ncbi:uncharacterized protein [Epargyreus clarus]|uniref:uncharacterized protein n=1 Tax=Epargyreus clarus TaxID=520877 RepID=UPI003C2E3D37